MHPDDRRKSIIRLTRAGRQLVNRAYPVHHRTIEQAMSAISPADRRKHRQPLLALGKSFDERFPPKT
jgi:DNA-binding MarR family transcriptional regulator